MLSSMKRTQSSHLNPKEIKSGAERKFCPAFYITMKNTTIPIHEHFNAFQGEGLHMGRAAYFIRSYGCPLKCPWCDSAGTWHKDYRPVEGVKRMSYAAIGKLITDADARTVILTGGEPALFKWEPLREHIPSTTNLHIETSGSLLLHDASDLDFITVSPKWNKLPTRENLIYANEIKIIVEDAESIVKWEKQLGAILGVSFEKFVRLRAQSSSWKPFAVWLHPEWSERDNPDVLNSISNTIKAKPDLYRAGYQLHKLYQCDALDPNSAELVPLGGCPSKGY